MGCACKNRGKVERFVVKLPGGLKVPKNTEADAKRFAARHPGAVVQKSAA